MDESSRLLKAKEVISFYTPCRIMEVHKTVNLGALVRFQVGRFLFLLNLVGRMLACHARNPGSIPGEGVIFKLGIQIWLVPVLLCEKIRWEPSV